MERCLLVTIELRAEKGKWPKQDIAWELEELVKTAKGQPIEKIFCVRDKATPDFLIGKGKVEEIALICQDQDIDTVIFSHDLSGTQQRNLEEVIGKKTIDRTQLILDIFSHHAHSPEGNMQVELAQIEYLLPRLVGKGIMLSRLGGGIGTRGPGEQKLEVDRRRIQKRISKLKQDLLQLTNHRRVIRKKRRDEAIPCLALVGYTNAGKSTLLNALTGAGQHVENSLFTTLDPLSRRMEMPSGTKVVVSDTVGFLHNLPHHLIEAFHATLEEIEEADFLINVLDASHPRIQERHQAVLSVLKELNCEGRPLITVLNKIDLVEDKAWLSWLEEKFVDSVSISAKSGENLDQLLKKIDNLLQPQLSNVVLLVPLNQMAMVGFLYRQGNVKQVEYGDENVKIEVNIPKNILSNLLKNKDIRIIS
ncbi:GTPase HflX [Candidatus Omnitrophota bacterium]